MQVPWHTLHSDSGQKISILRYATLDRTRFQRQGAMPSLSMEDLLQEEESEALQMFSRLDRSHIFCFLMGMCADLLVDLYRYVRRAVRRFIFILDRWAMQPVVRLRAQ